MGRAFASFTAPYVGRYAPSQRSGGVEMSDLRYLDWPFFEPRHAALQAELDAWANENISQDAHGDVDAGLPRPGRGPRRRRLAAARGRRHRLRRRRDVIDVRGLSLGREILGRSSALADFALAMQGLGCRCDRCSADVRSGSSPAAGCRGAGP